MLLNSSLFFSLSITISLPHDLFMKRQQELRLKVVQLKKLSDTRWYCRYASIKAMLTSLSAIIATLNCFTDSLQIMKWIINLIKAEVIRQV